MKKHLLTLLFLSLLSLNAGANLPTPQAPLPELLQLQDGTHVTNAKQWEELARPELLELFCEHIYGRSPLEAPAKLDFQILERSPALNATAEKLLINIHIEGPHGKVTLPMHLYLPLNAEKTKGCFIFIPVRGRQLMEAADTEPNTFWPVAEIIARNYATAAIHKNDLAPDRLNHSFGGVFAAYEAASTDREQRPADAWGTIAAWAWGASRAIDALETLPELEAVPFAVVGHSRSGKAALWAGAQDPRIALTVSNNSGNSGAALARTTRGETVAIINERFPYWFNLNYRNYNGNEAQLPVDQHQLLALIAPRLVYVASASEDAWADPQSEFQAAQMATAAFTLYRQPGLIEQGFPATGTALHEGKIGYHLRAGKHDLVTEDWLHFMDFADRHLPEAQPHRKNME